MKPLWKVKDSFDRTLWKVPDVQIVRYTWVLSLSLCLCLCLCLCVLRVVRVVVEEKGRDLSDHLVAGSLRSFPHES